MTLKKIHLFFFFLISVVCFGQTIPLDKVIAVVGDKIILKSDVDQQIIQLKAQGVRIPTDVMTCKILEELLVQKLMVNQAELDSLQVSPAQVEMQLNQRIDYMIEQFGSKEKMEEFFGKKLYQLKNDYKTVVYEQLLSQRMEGEITGTVHITPSEIRDYYNTLPKDSIPFIETELEISQIVKYPSTSEEAIMQVRENLLALRKRILNGEKFSTLAVLYSEDPGAFKGGEIGFLSKAELDPEYAKAAFKLKEGGVSGIVESQFGFHLIQLVEMRNNKVNTRHILMRPKYSSESLKQAKTSLDSILTLIRTNDTLSFSEASALFSDDPDSRISGGRMINPVTGTYKYNMEDLSPQEQYVVKNLKPGEISEPFETTDSKGKKAYKIIQLKKVTEAHHATLKLDYDLIKQHAVSAKKEDMIEEWIKEKLTTTYVHIDKEYASCEFYINGWIKE